MQQSTGPRESPCLGIDTGGTYTDAVLWSETAGVIAKAKALTTQHDLAEGIASAVDRVLSASGLDPAAIGLVSMSTTLATNALVEGRGLPAGLVMIGFSKAELSRDGLGAALARDPVVFLDGGHDVHGNESPLDTAPLEEALPGLAASVSALAVCACFAVRNPAHEIAVCALVRARTGLPVTASHQLSAKLGGPRRALTTLLNARLIALVDRLIAAAERFLDARGIAAPLMIVRGDGALISAAFARQRPIETILSGPAASLVGAHYLTGLDNALVADIGGTTTDVAIIDGGRPRLDPEGATVGGLRTMVEAVAMRTFGLGGDSEVVLEDGGLKPQIGLGPRRLVPLSLAAHLHGPAIAEIMERQLSRPNAGRLDGRFAWRTGLAEGHVMALSAGEERLFSTMPETPASLDSLLSSAAQAVTLDRLVARGLVQLSGFTPSDAAHVAGRQTTWDGRAARLGAALFARRRDRHGLTVAASAEAAAEGVLARLTRRSAEAMLETALARDGLEGAPEMIGHPLVQRALDGVPATARLKIALDRPVVGLGASAPLHYAGLSPLVGNDCAIPGHADVANAIGAVVGQVRVSAEASVSQPQEGRFRVTGGGHVRDFTSEEEALAFAEGIVRDVAAERALAAGAEGAETTLSRDIRAATVEGNRAFVEATLTATASGRPRATA